MRAALAAGSEARLLCVGESCAVATRAAAEGAHAVELAASRASTTKLPPALERLPPVSHRFREPLEADVRDVQLVAGCHRSYSTHFSTPISCTGPTQSVRQAAVVQTGDCRKQELLVRPIFIVEPECIALCDPQEAPNLVECDPAGLSDNLLELFAIATHQGCESLTDSCCWWVMQLKHSSTLRCTECCKVVDPRLEVSKGCCATRLDNPKGRSLDQYESAGLDGIEADHNLTTVGSILHSKSWSTTGHREPHAWRYGVLNRRRGRPRVRQRGWLHPPWKRCEAG
mmetsp:Transcript_107258/g.277575  ORF Transcript_107258/g.277575 Transcript_107258/m.277575 type:complete len:285 (-) Transcript_107258:530-1384(-)